MHDTAPFPPRRSPPSLVQRPAQYFAPGGMLLLIGYVGAYDGGPISWYLSAVCPV